MRPLLLLVVISSTLVAGQTFPYKCSARELCSNLRNYIPNFQEFYTAKYSGFRNDTLEFTLNNTLGNVLNLNIWGISEHRYRLIIEEPDHHRYKLQYSLVKEPVIRSLSKVDTSISNVVTAEDGHEHNQVKVFLKPFRIEFWQHGSLRQIFDGDRLIMQNNASSQAFAFNLKFNQLHSFLGLHEHADWMKLRHTADGSIDPYRLKNVDFGMAGYNLLTTDAGYGSVPVLYGFGGNVTSGVFLHNAAEMYVDIDTIKKEAYFMVDGGTLDLFVLLGPSLNNSVKQYLDLTGHPHMPQLWALGYHQCRWAYSTTEDVETTIQGFDNASFPLDVLWLDIEYTANRKWFTWNYTSFPDPEKMLNWVDSQAHRKIVPISDPHIKTDNNYPIFTQATNQHLFLMDERNERPYVGTCWPGNASWIDFLNPKARDFYARLHHYDNFPSTPTLAGFWNDMNEPATFDVLPERTVPFGTTHHGNVKHRDVHNMYGMLQVMSTHQGLMERDQGKVRPFILNRSFFAGSQRYAAKWSGDNWSRYDNIRIAVPMALTANLAGNAFYGADIPGFNLPNLKNDEEVYIRWYQLGIWIPFFRGHSNEGIPRREPFRFTAPTQVIVRDAMQLRYKHLPYWYTLFYEHVRFGDPIIRPMLFEYPLENATYNLNDQFLVGKNILVASVFNSSVTNVSMYFPGGSQQSWFQITGEPKVYNGSDEFINVPVNLTFAPVFYRGGSIIVRRETVRRSSTEMMTDPHTLYITLGQDNKASGKVYIDDYESFEYQNINNCLFLTLHYDAATNALDISEDEQCKPQNLQFVISDSKIIKLNADTTYSISSRKDIVFKHPLVRMV